MTSSVFGNAEEKICWVQHAQHYTQKIGAGLNIFVQDSKILLEI
jgi:hypothetical protein